MDNLDKSCCFACSSFAFCSCFSSSLSGFCSGTGEDSGVARILKAFLTSVKIASLETISSSVPQKSLNFARNCPKSRSRILEKKYFSIFFARIRLLITSNFSALSAKSCKLRFEKLKSFFLISSVRKSFLLVILFQVER